MNNDPLKIGMLGAGFILKSHALAVEAIEGAVLHAVADTSSRRAEDAARQFGFAAAFKSVDELARSDCDVVHVLVPPVLHIEAAEALLEAGKSVFLEKPMGLSSKECRRLGALAEEKGLRLGVNHNFLFLPAYEKLRSSIAGGELGRVDHIGCTWLHELPQLQSGPFDAWMLGAPANLFFELGPHLAAFVVDLLGSVEIDIASARNPVDLPNGGRAYRSWTAAGQGGSASFSLSLSTTQGHSDRNLRIRASGGSAQLDFGRDIGWHERTGPPNPIFDSYESAREIKRQLAAIAKRDRRRRIIDAVRKSPRSTPFAESILRSVERFYASFNGEPDRRQHWSLGADTIEICENVARLAGVGPPSTNPIVVPGTKKPAAAPSVLVVGGTGFIGQQLVRKLLAKGLAVRVLSRSRTAAAIAFAGEAVDIFEGSHGNREVAKAALAGIDTVYHLAKCDGQNWNDYIRGDIEPTRVLAEESLAAGVKRFIYTGTIDSYDSASPRRRITGDTPLDPAISRRNLYARSKARCEELLKAVAREQGLPLIVLRPGIVIGEGAPVTHIGVAQFVSETEVTYWGRGDNKLPLVLVEDVADALAAAADAPGIIGKSFLLTSDPLLSARDYVEEFSAHSGVTPRASNRSAVRYWLADIVKETVKNLIRHPNRRWPSLHDWRCRAHRSVYDSSGTREALGWRPVSDRELMIERGVRAAFDAANRRPSRK